MFLGNDKNRNHSDKRSTLIFEYQKNGPEKNYPFSKNHPIWGIDHTVFRSYFYIVIPHTDVNHI